MMHGMGGARRGPTGGRGRGPMRRGGPMAMMKGDKARDFKGTLTKLLQYLGAYRISILIVMIVLFFQWRQRRREKANQRT